MIARRRATTSIDETTGFEPQAPGDPYAQDATRRALEAALRQLPDDFREAVVLCDVAGLGAGEAAAVLGLPTGTVKSRVHRGRAQLAALLREPSGVETVEGAG